VPHIVELWEMSGEGRTTYAPACLACGWTGAGGTRLQAEREAEAHEAGEAPLRIADERSALEERRPGDPPTHSPA
jgi:hypothetical protein